VSGPISFPQSNRYSSVYIFASQVTAVLLPESRHISNRAHNEAADRRDIPEFELDISWTGNETHGVQPPVSKELLEEGKAEVALE